METGVTLNEALMHEFAWVMSDEELKVKALKSLRKLTMTKRERAIEEIPEQYRCDPFLYSPSGDPFWADIRNIQIIKQLQEETEQDSMTCVVKDESEIDKLLGL